MTIFNRIWPWSRIAKLETELEAERQRHDRTDEFASACLAYIDQIEPGVQHIRLSNKLYCMGVDHCNVVERDRTTFSVGCVAKGTETEL